MAADNDNMDGLNDISESNRTKRYDESPVDENVCWYDLFRDVGTQVEENDILRESELLEERVILDNSPPSSTVCVTGVAETATFGNCGQIFGTAKLNTEPRLTFMLPLIRSAFDGNVTQSSPGSTSMNDKHETFGVSVVEPSCNLPSLSSTSSFPPVTSLSVMSPHVTSQPITTLATSMSSTVTSVTMTSAKDTTITMTFPQVTSATTSKLEQMTSPPVTSQPITTFSKSAEMTSQFMTSPPVTSDSTESLNKMLTDSTSTPTMAFLPVTSSPMTSDSLVTSPLFLPLPTTNVLDSSKKRLSPKLSDGSRSRGLSPRRSPKPCNEQGTVSRSPSPLLRKLRTRVSIDTPGQSREQTRDITSVSEKQTLTGVPESMVRSSTKKVTVEKTTQEQSSSEKSTPDESVIEQYSSSEKTTSEQNTTEQLISKQNIPEKRTPMLLTGSLVYTPEYVPLLTTVESSAQQTAESAKPVLEASKTSSSSLEKSTTGYTGKTGSSSPVMIASTSSAGSSGNEQANHSVSGKKRRRTGARSLGKGKRKKSRTVMDKTGDVVELKDRLPQRRNRSSYKVKELEDVDTNPELSRTVSHAGSLGRVSSNPNTRLRSRNGSKLSNISSTDVIPSNDVTTSDVINNEVISNSDITSANDVISKQLSETGDSEMAML